MHVGCILFLNQASDDVIDISYHTYTFTQEIPHVDLVPRGDGARDLRSVIATQVLCRLVPGLPSAGGAIIRGAYKDPVVF